MIVGSMSTVWSGVIPPSKEPKTIQYPSSSDETTTNNKNDNLFFKKGDEIGLFQLGSTVVLLFEQDKMQFDDDLSVNQTMRLGQPIGSCLP